MCQSRPWFSLVAVSAGVDCGQLVATTIKALFFFGGGAAECRITNATVTGGGPFNWANNSSSHICKTKNSAINPPLVVCPSPCPQNSRVRFSLPGYCRSLVAHASEAPQQFCPFPEGSPWVHLVLPRVKSISLSAGSTQGRINVLLFWLFLHQKNGWSLFRLFSLSALMEGSQQMAAGVFFLTISLK